MSALRLWRPALAGVLAMAAGLAAAEVAAGALGRTTTPAVAAGEAFIDVVPGWLKDLAISWFGTADKVALGVGMVVVLAAVAAAIGVLTARRRQLGVAAAIALIVVAGAIVWSRPDTSSGDLVPTVVAGLVAVPVLTWLVGQTTQSDVTAGSGVPTSGSRATRRRFLTGAGAVAALSAVGGGIGRWLGAQRVDVEASRQSLTDRLALPEPKPPDGADLGVTGVDPWRTPNPDFYRIDTALRVPLLNADDWRLRVHGLVDREVELDYDSLVAMGTVDRWITLTCVSNEVGGSLVGNAYWTGVPVADVLALAGVQSAADAVLSTSDDGWTAGTPLSALTDGRDALLAVAMNGEPLPVEHGFPVRMVVPGLYGYVSATKWVVDLEVSRFDRFAAYWTTRGWAERGPIKVASRIDVPRRGDRVTAGRVRVAGVAWAQARGIAAVEVRVDEGPWEPATLAAVPSVDTWRQWVWDWDATAGDHRLQVRATTVDGEVQTGDSAPPVPDGATGWHAVDVEVV